LHDPTCINQFQENNIVIPLAAIEEIDHFKRGSQVINLNTREFGRTLDSLIGNLIFNGGVSLGKGKGKLELLLPKVSRMKYMKRSEKIMLIIEY